jgi:hypothetical protein
LRWGASWSDRWRDRRQTDAFEVVTYRDLIGERGDEPHAAAAARAKGAVDVENPRQYRSSIF